MSSYARMGGAPTRRAWNHSLFSCFDDIGVCCKTCFCPCVTAGRVAEHVGKRCSVWATTNRLSSPARAAPAFCQFFARAYAFNLFTTLQFMRMCCLRSKLPSLWCAFPRARRSHLFNRVYSRYGVCASTFLSHSLDHIGLHSCFQASSGKSMKLRYVHCVHPVTRGVRARTGSLPSSRCLLRLILVLGVLRSFAL